jgi:hypothetical protein
MADWQRIDTAPTDAQDLLVSVAPGGRQLVARWSPEHQSWVAGDAQVIAPTHWQPLPDPVPADAAGGPPPLLTALDPMTAALGDPSFTLRVTGEGFVPNAVILWNGGAEPTTVVSATEVTTEVNLATASVAMPIPIQVRNGLGGLSNTLTFALTEAGMRLDPVATPQGDAAPQAPEGYEGYEAQQAPDVPEAPHAKRGRPRRDA